MGSATCGEYNIRLVGPDELWGKARVEIHAPDKLSEIDFLGVDPSRTDIAMIDGGRQTVASRVTTAERAILLADNTREFHNSLTDEAMAWLQQEVVLSEGNSTYVMNADEREIAELLGLKKPSWNVYSPAQGSENAESTSYQLTIIRHFCELQGREVPSMDSPEYRELQERADRIREGTDELLRKFMS